MKKLLLAILLATTAVAANAQTRNFVPRGADEGNVGLSTKPWHAVYATKFYGDGSELTGLSVTETDPLAVKLLGSYSQPTWLTSILGSIVSGDIPGYAANITGNLPASQVAAGNLGVGVIASSIAVGAVQDASIVSVSGSKVSGNIAGQAGTVANGVYTTGTYSDPTWLTAIAGSKVTGNISGTASNISGNLAAAQVAAGSLGSGVIASSIAVGAVQDASIVSVSGTKVSGNIAGNAATATALATTPNVCPAGQVPTGVDAQGNAVGCFTTAGSSYTADEVSLNLVGTEFRANPSSVTLMANTFNGADQLVKLDGSGALPAVSGVNLTGITLVEVDPVWTSEKSLYLTTTGDGSGLTGVVHTEADPVVAAITGIVKSDGSTISAAAAGTDYQAPIVAGIDYLAPTGDGSGLTGVIHTEVDPVFGASTAAGIDNTDVSNWDTAYGWGNHAGLYLPLTGGTLSDNLSVDGSVTAATFVGNGAGITGVPGDNLGNHVGTTTLQMGAYGVNTSSTVNAGIVNSGRYDIAGQKAIVMENTAAGGFTKIGMDGSAYNLTGDYSTIVGANAGYNNGGRTGNTYTGYLSGYTNSVGGRNTGMGAYSLYRSSGSGNTAFGYASLHGADTNLGLVEGNTAIGEYSGSGLQVGKNNVFIGDYAGSSMATGDGNILIGHSAQGGLISDGDNQLNIGDVISSQMDDGRVAINRIAQTATGTFSIKSKFTTQPIITAENTTGTVVSSMSNTGVWTAAGFVGPLTGTATSLAANGTNCSAGQAALGVDASGNSEGCWTPGSGAGDNLGNHIATTTLQMGNYRITSSSSIAAIDYLIGATGVPVLTINGIQNSYVGVRTSSGNLARTTGDGNAFVGYAAGATATSGSGNSVLGSYAGPGITSGTNNVFVGQGAGRQVTTGSSNTVVGALAGYTGFTGSNNILIGYGVEGQTAGDSNQLNIGNLIYGVVGGSSVTVSGNLYATKFWGDGSGLSNLPAGTESDPVVKSINGIVKSNGSTISAAVAGTDYLTPTGSGAGLTNLTAANISAGSLGSGVIASSVAVGSVQDEAIVAVSGSKVSGNISGNAGTSTALAANGTNCSNGQAALGVDASGNAEGCWTPSGATYSADGVTLAESGGVFSAKASSVTLQGNTFNGASQLVKLGSDGKLPAVDGSNLTGITGGTSSSFYAPLLEKGTTTIATDSSDAILDAACRAEFGSHARSARIIEVVAFLNFKAQNIGSMAVKDCDESVSVSALASYFYRGNDITNTISYPTSASPACVYDDAIVMFTTTTTNGSSSAVTRDAMCVAEFGSNYKAISTAAMSSLSLFNTGTLDSPAGTGACMDGTAHTRYWMTKDGYFKTVTQQDVGYSYSNSSTGDIGPVLCVAKHP